MVTVFSNKKIGFKIKLIRFYNSGFIAKNTVVYHINIFVWCNYIWSLLSNYVQIYTKIVTERKLYNSFLGGSLGVLLFDR